jgi:hypothetical protein
MNNKKKKKLLNDTDYDYDDDYDDTSSSRVHLTKKDSSRESILSTDSSVSSIAFRIEEEEDEEIILKSSDDNNGPSTNNLLMLNPDIDDSRRTQNTEAFNILPSKIRKASQSNNSNSNNSIPTNNNNNNNINSTNNESDFRSSSSYMHGSPSPPHRFNKNKNNNTNTKTKSLSKLIVTPPPTPNSFLKNKFTLKNESHQQLAKTNSSLYSQQTDDSGLDLQAELFKRINDKSLLLSSNKRAAGATVLSVRGRKVDNITSQSACEQVKEFLIKKEFSKKVVLMFGELNGGQLFSLNKFDFEKFCGKEEGARLDSNIKVQKSLCGFKETTNELQEILQVRKEKSES